ncbi:hypothetical protein ACP4OV_023949 [Aristida adscensionis]
MLFRVSGCGRAAPAGRRRRTAVARLGDTGAARRGRLVFPRLRLRALLLRSRRALARLGQRYGEVMRGLIADAAAAEPAKARESGAAAAVVPAAVAGAVLRCNSHHYIR